MAHMAIIMTGTGLVVAGTIIGGVTLGVASWSKHWQK